MVFALARREFGWRGKKQIGGRQRPLRPRREERNGIREVINRDVRAQLRIESGRRKNPGETRLGERVTQLTSIAWNRRRKGDTRGFVINRKVTSDVEVVSERRDGCPGCANLASFEPVTSYSDYANFRFT